MKNKSILKLSITLFALTFYCGDTMSLYAQTIVEIGQNWNGNHAISSPAPSDAVPYNYNNNSVHLQFIYLGSELLQGGASGAFQIDSIGWYVYSQIGGNLNNYTIKMKHTGSTSTTTYDGSGLTVVRNPATLLPASDTAWYMIPLDNPFQWNGTNNILIDVCWEGNPSSSPTGQIRHLSVTSGYERILLKSNFSNTCSQTPTQTAAFKPYLRLIGNCTLSMSYLTQNACFGDTVIFNGQALTQSGNYTDTLVSIQGCDSLVQLQLTFTAIDTSIYVNGNTLTSTTGNAVYQWLDCNNGLQPVTGATSIAFSPQVNGSYAVSISKGGCSDTSGCHTIVLSGYGGIDNPQLQLFPNPTTGLVYVRHSGRDVPYVIYNVYGSNVKSGLLSKYTELDLKEWPEGVYWLLLEGSAIKIFKQ